MREEADVARRGTAKKVVAYIGMAKGGGVARRGTAYIVMAYIVMAYIVMANGGGCCQNRYSLYTYGLYTSSSYGQRRGVLPEEVGTHRDVHGPKLQHGARCQEHDHQIRVHLPLHVVGMHAYMCACVRSCMCVFAHAWVCACVHVCTVA